LMNMAYHLAESARSFGDAMKHKTWRIEMFGGLKARKGDRELTHFQTRKVGALLACLALQPTASHPREVLAEQLWPEEDWEASRNRLRHALSCLRHDLELDTGFDGSVIFADRTYVSLNPLAIITDVAEFEAALKNAGSLSESDSRAGALGAAIELYRGELLPGYFEECVLAERQRLEEVFVGALISYARALADSGNHAS